MRLSQIKLAGFKSFVDPTTIRFPSDLVGVVGPNGCGKSNIIDAVRWVMGESSKHLRGDTMEDVIFNGSTARKPVGQASIELVFDNSDGAAGGQYAKYRELALRRTVARDGQSKYFLNGANCRRRDVTDIFLGTGLGRRSYAIIEQGTISRLIEARPEDLRVYLEEAAGISIYKERRRETENRIRRARENISRLNDLREEVVKQINHLERQAKAAAKYQMLKQEEHKAKAALLALRWRHQQQEATARERLVNEYYTRQQAAIAQLRSTEAEIEKLRLRHAEANEAVSDVQARYYQVGGDISRTEQAIQHHKILRDRQAQELEQVCQARRIAESELTRDREASARSTNDIATLEPQLERAQAELDTDARALADAEQAVSQWQAQSEKLTLRAAGPEQTAQVESVRIEHLKRQLAQLNQRLTRMVEEQRQLSASDMEAKIEQLRLQAAEARLELARRQEQLKAAMASVVERRECDRALNQRLGEARKRLQQASGRLSALEVLQEAALGKHEQAVAQWLHGHGLSGAPRLAEQLEVIDGWERALETVLDHSLEAVCVKALEDAIPALVELRQGWLQLLDTSASGQILAGTRAFANNTLASKVDGPSAVKSMLSQIYLAADLSQALSMRQGLEPGASVVTADGVWIGHNWLRVMRESDGHGGVLAREVEIKGLRTESADLNRTVEDLQVELARSQNSLQELERARERLQAECNEAHRVQAEAESRRERAQHWLEQIIARKTHLADELREVQEHLERDGEELGLCIDRRDLAVAAVAALAGERELLAAKRPELQQRLADARAQARERQEHAHKLALRLEAIRASQGSMQQGLKRMQAQLEQLERRQFELSAAVEQGLEPLRVLEQTLADLLQKRLEIKRELNAARAGMEDIETALREQYQRRLEVERRCEALRAEFDSQRMAWQDANIRCQALQEQFAETGLNLDTILNELNAEVNAKPTVEEWEAQVENLARRIERLGPINLAAIDEFREQNQRKKCLDRQHADLTEALETLENAIHKIDRETRARFKETFDKVNARLQEMFPRLFGGGQAHLEMIDEDLLTTGMVLMARPPGKRLSTIHLMSGGEKALTAVALVFAIFELNPAPFCLLDEVDAPLDDANVGRFCELVKEMSQRVQLVFITHNKTTMEYAEQLIGVTMHEPGVSRLVAVDVEEAAKMATG